MSEVKTEATTTPFILTVLVDMSHENFKERGLKARVALYEVLSGLAHAALRGADATLVQDEKGVTMGIYLLTPDEAGEGRQAFEMSEKLISGEAYREVYKEDRSVPVEG